MGLHHTLHTERSIPTTRLTSSSGTNKVNAGLDAPLAEPSGSWESSGRMPEAQNSTSCFDWNHFSPVAQGCCAHGLEVRSMLQVEDWEANVS